MLFTAPFALFPVQKIAFTASLTVLLDVFPVIFLSEQFGRIDRIVAARNLEI